MQDVTSCCELVQVSASHTAKSFYNKDLVQILLVEATSCFSCQQPLKLATHWSGHPSSLTPSHYTLPMQWPNTTNSYICSMLSQLHAVSSHSITLNTMSNPGSVASSYRLWQVIAGCCELLQARTSYRIAHCEELFTIQIWYRSCALAHFASLARRRAP